MLLPLLDATVIAIYKTRIWILLNEYNNESIRRFIGHFLGTDLVSNIHFLSEAFLGDSSGIIAIDPGVVLRMGLGGSYRTELLQHRFLGMSSQLCLAATSRAHSGPSQLFAGNQVPSADLFHSYLEYKHV